jgi:hypothetical protein
VATDLSREVLRKLARLGARQRLEELKQEEAAIRAAFPDLASAPAVAGNKGRGRKGRAKAAASESAPAAKRPARYKMSAAQKRAVSERMKKYWAARRKAKG